MTKLLKMNNNYTLAAQAVARIPDASRSITIQVKTMSEGNTQGWRLGTDICTRKNNELLFTVLVNLKGSEVDYYIYEYDILSQKVEQVYTDYIKTPKQDGTNRKDVNFRWFDFRNFTSEDYERKNNWSILGF